MKDGVSDEFDGQLNVPQRRTESNAVGKMNEQWKKGRFGMEILAWLRPAELQDCQRAIRRNPAGARPTSRASNRRRSCAICDRCGPAGKSPDGSDTKIFAESLYPAACRWSKTEGKLLIILLRNFKIIISINDDENANNAFQVWLRKKGWKKKQKQEDGIKKKKGYETVLERAICCCCCSSSVPLNDASWPQT